VKGLLKDAGHKCGFTYGHRPFGDALGDGLDIDGLEILFVQLCAGRLAGDAEDGYAIGECRVEAGDHVGAGRAGGADAHTDIAVFRTRKAVSHVGGAFDMARQDVADGAARLHGGIERVDGSTRNAEGDGNSLALEHAHGGIDGSHSGHVSLPGGSVAGVYAAYVRLPVALEQSF
jgi:hypothetical protein